MPNEQFCTGLLPRLVREHVVCRAGILPVRFGGAGSPAYAYLRSSFLVGRAFLPAAFLMKGPPEPKVVQSSGGFNLYPREPF